MPRPFNSQEQAIIAAQLKATALKMFSANGLAKMSVEQLTKSVGISKGSFYRFYDSKELLYFELLEETQNRIREPLIQGVEGKKPDAVDFEKRCRSLFSRLCDEPLIRFMAHEHELKAIMRRVPVARLAQHQNDDQAFIEQLIELWNSKPVAPSKDEVAANITLLLIVSLQRPFIGERLLPHAVDSAISCLKHCFFVT